MRTLTTPAIAKSPTATLWDTPVPVAAPITTAPTSAPVATVASDDKPPFDVPDEPTAKEPEVTGSISFATAPGEPFEQIGEIVGQVFSVPGSKEPFDAILFLKEHKLLDPIYAAHRSIIESEQRELELENELTDLRFELGNLRDAKREMLEALPVQLFAIRTGTSPAAVVPKSPKPESTPAAPTVPDNAWRAILTNTITKGVVGLGVKKADTLIDEFPTLGDLCDAMARATAAHRHFADELPKGIGKQSADELANRVMAAQTNGDTRPAAEVVEPRKKKITADIGSICNGNESHATFVREWLKETLPTITEKNIEIFKGESFDEGLDAAREGGIAFDCPEGLKRECQIEWLYGWVCYDKFHRTEQATETTDEIDADIEDHLRVVESAVEWLSDNPTELPVEKATDREIWQVGFDAAYEGALASDCPIEVATTSEESAITEAKQVDWLRGWCAAMIEIAKGATVTEPVTTVTNTHDDVPPILSAATESKLIAAATTPTVSEAAQIANDVSTLAGPDDIAEIAEKVKADPDRRSRTCRDSWEQGYQAAVDEYPLESFPNIPLPELTDWVRGWVAGSEVDFAGL